MLAVLAPSLGVLAMFLLLAGLVWMANRTPR
jgi:hypothetical protein